MSCISSIIPPKRLRFGSDDDLCLLREVVNKNPIQNPKFWTTVKENVHIATGKSFTIRALKDRTILLLQQWIKKDDVFKNKSGVEELYSEKDKLLQEIRDIMREFNLSLNNVNIKKSTNRNQLGSIIGKQHRDECAASLNAENVLDDTVTLIFNTENEKVDETETNVEAVDTNVSILDNNEKATTSKESVPVLSDRKIAHSRRIRCKQSATVRKNALGFLQERGEKEFILKQKELSIEEEKLQLEKRKIKLKEDRWVFEKEERLHNLEMEKKRFKFEVENREKENALILQQQKIIDALLKKLEMA